MTKTPIKKRKGQEGANLKARAVRKRKAAQIRNNMNIEKMFEALNNSLNDKLSEDDKVLDDCQQIKLLKNLKKESNETKQNKTQSIKGFTKINKPAQSRTVKKEVGLKSFFQNRRSKRQCDIFEKAQKTSKIVDKIINNVESNIKVVEIPMKGRGIVSTKPFERNEFVVEYAGDLIDSQEAQKREELYQQDKNIGCYMYYFNSRGKNFCIDATAESGRLGRLLNHSRQDPNCYTKLMWFPNSQRFNHSEEMPHLTIVAKRDIQKGEELLYDYGDTSKKNMEAYPWLKL